MFRKIGVTVRAFVCACVLGGCAGVPATASWCEDVSLTPGWERVGRAAVHALRSPRTWAPVAAAALLQIGDMDDRISDWAIEHAPVFGSRSRAADVSTVTETLGHALVLATLVAMPGEDSAGRWARSKAMALGIALAGNAVQQETSTRLKDAFGRPRPLDGGKRSFPSGHATDIAFSATLVQGNLRSMPMPRRLRIAANVGLYLLQGGSAWSRVEAGVHHPADVLAGLALGHFMAEFVNEAFLHSENPRSLALGAGPAGSVGLSVIWSF